MKTIFTRLLFLLLLAGGPILTLKGNAADVSSPGSITGRISDSDSKKPLEFVNIILHAEKGSSMVAGTITDSEGKFYLSMLEPGKYYLEVLSNGYEKKRIESVEIGKDLLRKELGEITLSASNRKNLKKNTIWTLLKK